METAQAELPRVRLGASLRSCRETAGLSRAALAKLAGVSPETIKNIEGGAVDATPRTLLHLSAIPSLRFDPNQFGMFLPGAAEGPLNCWLAPGFDGLAMLQSLERLLAGAGGPLDQSLMYLDHKSAACWRAIANQVDYVQAVTHSFPAERAAEAMIGHALQNRKPGSSELPGIDILALGCGDAKTETILAQHVLAQVAKLKARYTDINLYLLDISQPLLAAAHKHCTDQIGSVQGFNIYAIQGDFYQLPQYAPILYSRTGRTRIVWMIGCTFANLLNETMYVRDSLVGLNDRDLLLLDLSLAYGVSDEEIKQRDPRLNGTLPSGWQKKTDEFFSGPFVRYLPDMESIDLTPRLDRSCCPIPGSYAVEIMARVLMKDGTEKVFNAFRVKRHEINQLVAAMKELHWRPVTGWPYAETNGKRPMAGVHLFRKES